MPKSRLPARFLDSFGPYVSTTYTDNTRPVFGVPHYLSLTFHAARDSCMPSDWARCKHSILSVHQLPSPDNAMIMHLSPLAQYLQDFSSVWSMLKLTLVKCPYHLTGKRLGAIPWYALATRRYMHTSNFYSSYHRPKLKVYTIRPKRH